MLFLDPAYHHAPHCPLGCLGAYALDVGAAETVCAAGEVARADSRRQRFVPQMDLKDPLATLLVRQGDVDDLIKTPRSQDGRIEHVRPVGRTQHKHPPQFLDTIELREKLA